MSRGERDLEGLSGPEEALAHRLEALGSLMERQERAEADLDPGFVDSLRAHLVYGESFAPGLGL